MRRFLNLELPKPWAEMTDEEKQKVATAVWAQMVADLKTEDDE